MGIRFLLGHPSCIIPAVRNRYRPEFVHTFGIRDVRISYTGHYHALRFDQWISAINLWEIILLTDQRTAAGE